MIDQPTAELLDQLGATGAPPLDEQTPAEARQGAAFFIELNGPGPELVGVENRSISGNGGGGAGTIGLRILTPSEQPRGVIAYYHGGGWVLGSIDEFDAFGRHLAARSGYTVVLVDYRLAPEHRFPAAVEDASDALQWVADHLSELAGPQAPLIVAGDSAGGNLAAVVAQRARGGDIPIALQLLIYPVVDCDLERPSYVDPGNQLFLDRAGMEWFWSHYIPDPAKRADPAASPLRAADLSGLPPAVVLTAEHDPLRDEGEEYARRLADAGVPVELRRFDRQMHAFCMFVGVLASSLEAIDWLTAAAGRALPTAPA